MPAAVMAGPSAEASQAGTQTLPSPAELPEGALRRNPGRMTPPIAEESPTGTR